MYDQRLVWWIFLFCLYGCDYGKGLSMFPEPHYYQQINDIKLSNDSQMMLFEYINNKRFENEDARRTTSIYELRTDGTHLKLVTNGVDLQSAHWRPDGLGFYFFRRTQHIGARRHIQQGFFTLERDGSFELEQENRYALSVELSPDGKYLLFAEDSKYPVQFDPDTERVSTRNEVDRWRDSHYRLKARKGDLDVLVTLPEDHPFPENSVIYMQWLNSLDKIYIYSRLELEVGEDTSSAQDAYAVADLDVMTGKVSNIHVFRKMPILPRLGAFPTLRIVGMSQDQKSVVYVTRRLVNTNTGGNINISQLHRHDLDSGKEEKSEDIRYAPLLTIVPQQVFPDLKRFVHVHHDWIVISDLDGSNPQRLFNFREQLPKGELNLPRMIEYILE
jgi:hypothetical protein